MSRQFPAKRLGVLMVVSGPSGSGKTTLCRKLADLGEVVYSISATTRAPRPGEAHGRDYYFFSEEEFLDNVQRGEFFEHARVHGNLYGTLKTYVKQNLERGIDVVMDIDVQGAAQVRACADELVQRCLVDVFIMPPNVEALRERLAGRGTESEEKLSLRLQNALTEIEHWHEYRYALVSDTRELDLDRFRGLLLAERMRVERLLD
ncbi:guanylate kinase [Roseimicrobium sp. ORNL1]|uniref:guanylate kinase n=1 Tax=Roseimicrobium sp. ORNL1 TaxID=2711231 RepID=UPI0013E1E717|nr:guanylate kinase [Roseimicrobium sp. ORNL1]QIF00373.1 guanylate kinase [Roseimicrobium sp. ORNL1]